ncbi:ssDNA-binding transcriptional regulator [Micractinium conductrix]|uniref:SsDNA-binding transcriptional regulator n=1 Tax=Micractinium conductrix TaxID=554055 RepID=A0A2P6VDF7_9CHLO|nr:ssDNA-binding transcriptional regulator [Micractinium conductrix]|eukprot:PSC72124.1 ssDNA-binding transcriptional regulator [Micractinium conductrix]
MAAALRCLASVGGGWRSAAALPAARSSLLPAIGTGLHATGFAQQRPAAHRLRVLSTAVQPYWADDSKPSTPVYTSHTIYKGKSAMAIKVIRPSWQQSGTGLSVAREGVVLLEFANALGTQQYDWQNKVTFGLSPLECAGVLHATDAGQEIAYFHDPNKGTPSEGSVTKNLRISVGDERYKGWMMSITINQSGAKSFMSCPVTDPEMRLMKTLFTYLIPRLMGFDEQFAGPPQMAASNGSPAPAGEAPF